MLKQETDRRLEAVPSAGMSIGRIVSIDPEGRVLVDFPGNRRGPRPALVLEPALSGRFDAGTGKPVLLALPEGPDGRPVLLGALAGSTGEPAANLDAARDLPAKNGGPPETATPPAAAVFGVRLPGRPHEAVVDGRRVAVEAEEEIVLRCGQASLTLRRNGRIDLRGVEIVSRASRTNRVRGASVQIN